MRVYWIEMRLYWLSRAPFARPEMRCARRATGTLGGMTIGEMTGNLPGDVMTFTFVSDFCRLGALHGRPAHLNNPCKCCPLSAHPAFELRGRNQSSPRPGERRGSAGFSRSVPSDPNAEALPPRCRAVLGRRFHFRSLGPGPRARSSRRQGIWRVTLI